MVIPRWVCLHFVDWTSHTTSLKKSLDERGIAHGDRTIKVQPSFEDPRETFKKPTLKAPKYSGRPFRDEVFSFGERGFYTGSSLEQYMIDQGFTDKGKEIARALFRFAVQPRAAFTQRAMELKEGKGWAIDHPMKQIDNLVYARFLGHEEKMHLDIFLPESLIVLRRIVNFDDPSKIISHVEWKTYTLLRVRAQLESLNSPSSKERK